MLSLSTLTTSLLLVNINQIETLQQQSALLVVGGLSRISVDKLDIVGRQNSPIIHSAEIIGCPANKTLHLPDYPQEIFGGQGTMLEVDDQDDTRVMVCGGANWTASHEQCYSWSSRSPQQWSRTATLNYPRAFGYMAYLPEPMCKVGGEEQKGFIFNSAVFQTNKLFILGGLDSVSLSPVLTTEVYDESTDSWMIHKQLPTTSDKNIFINRADSGCISSENGTIYSVGAEIVSLDWLTLSLKVLSRTKRSALAEGCVGLTLPSSNDSGFFFLSGDFYSLTQDKWTSFARPEPAFNMFALNNIPIILGIATLDPDADLSTKSDCSSSDPSCHSRMLTGDDSIVTFDLQSNSWAPYGKLEEARLGYSIAVTVPISMCPGASENSFLFKQLLPLEQLEQKNQFLPLEQTTSNTSLTDDEEDSLKMYDVSSSSVFQDKSFYFTSIIVLLLSETFSL